jgi:hypothetical protein
MDVALLPLLFVLNQRRGEVGEYGEMGSTAGISILVKLCLE